jgi:PAS domain S-box-containing protein
LLALAGWSTGRLALAGGGATLVPTAPVTALTILLLAAVCTIAIRTPVGRRSRLLALTLAGTAAAGTLEMLVEGLGGPGIGLSSLLAPPPGAAPGIRIGVMSPVTAALLALLAVALVIPMAAPGRRRLTDLAGVLAGIALASGVALAVAYLVGAPLFYATAAVPVALPTSLGIIALAAGVIAARVRDGRALGGILPVAAAIAIGMSAAAMLYGAVARVERDGAQLEFARSAAAVGGGVEQTLAGDVGEVGRLSLRFWADGGLRPEAFATIATAALADRPALLALAWAPRVADAAGGLFRVGSSVPGWAAAWQGTDLPASQLLEPGPEPPAAGPGPRAVPCPTGLAGPRGPAIVCLAMPVGAAGSNERRSSGGAQGVVLALLTLERAVAAGSPPGAGAARPRVELRRSAAGAGAAVHAESGEARAAAFARWESSFELAGSAWTVTVSPGPDDPAAPKLWRARYALAFTTVVTALFATFLAGRARQASQRERMLRLVVEGETRYRTLFESAGDAIFLVENGRFVDCNARTLAIFGCTREAILGRSPADFSPAVQRDGSSSAGAVAAHLGAALAGAPQAFEWLHARADGSPFDAEVTLNRVDVSGRTFVQAIVRDVTEQRRLRVVQSAMYEISQLASTPGSLDELYASIHGAIGRLMEARNFYISLYDPVNDQLSFPYFVDEMDPTPAPIPPGRGLTGYVLRTGKPLLADLETLAALEARGEIEPLGAPSIDWVGVPLKVGDETIGVLAVQSYSGAVHYGEAEAAILSYVSSQVAQAISHKRSEQAMQRLVIAVEQAAEMIVITDPAGTIEYVNPAFERITGYGKGEAIGRNPRLLKSGRQDEEFYRVLWRTIADGGAWSGRLVNRRKDGTLYEEEMSIAPVRDEQGRIVDYVAVKRDVSREAALQQQLNESQRMETIGRLAGGVAHDFNNLLQAMLSHVHLLEAPSLDRRHLVELKEELEGQIKRGAALTRQLLLFSRRESAKRERLDLNEAITRSGRMLRHLVRESIAFTIALHDEPLPVEADRGELDQVLLNLVVNAADAMPEGGTVWLRTGSEGRSVWLEVADTGSGIPDDVLPRIFEPFFTTKPREKGTGLGLAVVQGIVRTLGGTIGVQSRVGAGTRVRILLPMAGTAPVAPAARAAAGQAPVGAGEWVLVVEDEESARQGLERILTMLGYRAVAVGSAEEALALASEPVFDLLLTDLVLPGMHGGELMRRLVERWPGLEAIVMSGYTEDEAIRERIGRGTVRFLQKPFDVTTLAREISEALRRPKPS